MSDRLAALTALALKMHEGQVDKQGKPYSEHILAVTAAVSDWAKPVALFHEGRDHGTVTRGDGAHVRVRFDGERRSQPCHPLSLDYGDGVDPDAREAEHNRRIDMWNDRLNGRITAEEYVERMVAQP